MGTKNLIINEFIKIFKKKSTLVLIIISLLSVIAVGILYLNIDFSDSGINSDNEYIIKMNITNYQIKQSNATNEKEKELFGKKIDIYQYVLDNGYDNVFSEYYKNDVFDKLLLETEKLVYINKQDYKEQYDLQKAKVDRLWQILKEGTFEEFIEFNKAEIKTSYENKEITEEMYNVKINEQEQILKYGIGKYSKDNLFWKKELLSNIDRLNEKIETRYDEMLNIYLTDGDVQSLENKVLMETYRLENNEAPYFTYEQANYNINSYKRYNYNLTASAISIFFLGLLVIIFTSSCISEEISNGTVKFLIITPYKRYKILLAKFVVIMVILLVMTLILSQLSVIIGNIFFGVNTNNYLYVSNGQVKVMNTYLYETLTYILQIPEIVIYSLIGMACSVVITNVVSNIVALIMYIAVPFGIGILNGIGNITWLKYLPFTNMNLIDKILPVDLCNGLLEQFGKTSITFSIIILIITAILLLITMFDGFNKKEI